MWRPACRRNGTASGCGEEIEEDNAYLEKVRSEFESAGIGATPNWPMANRSRKSSSGSAKGLRSGGDEHARTPLLADIVLGTTASRVQHSISVPVLLLRAK